MDKNKSKIVEIVGRLALLDCIAGDVFYLRMLLCHDRSKRKKSETDLRTVNDIVHETCIGACKVLGLCQEDEEWKSLLLEADL